MNKAIANEIVEIAAQFLPADHIFKDGRSVYLKDVESDFEDEKHFNEEGDYVGSVGLAKDAVLSQFPWLDVRTNDGNDFRITAPKEFTYSAWLALNNID